MTITPKDHTVNTQSVNSFGAHGVLAVGDRDYGIFRLPAVHDDIHRLPYVVRILLENLLRHEDGVTVTPEHIESVLQWDPTTASAGEIPFHPARVVMPDSTGVACIVDMAAMREAVASLGGDPAAVEPRVPANLVIDHSVIVDAFGRPDALEVNVSHEYSRNHERYQLLRWGQSTFDQLAVVPPGAGIIHQVNLERLSDAITTRGAQAFPDTCIGTDSHTPMINGLGVLGWGVGGIEAESALLGQPLSLLIPEVVGLQLTGQLHPGVTATDLVLSITELLRRQGVVGKFVEFFGEGLESVSLPNRATIANMSPEYGSTVSIFPIDEQTLSYLRLTGRSPQQVDLVQSYARAQGLWHEPSVTASYSTVLEFDLSAVVPAIAGPRRPQDRIPLAQAKSALETELPHYRTTETQPADINRHDGTRFTLESGAVVIAAITSCTNTSNPAVMVTAGLLARNAIERGLRTKPWVKTSLAPGSRAVTEYLDSAGLTSALDTLGFQTVGYGCTTCIGNSGALPADVAHAVADHHIPVAAVLSGNRNFEGRVNPQVAMNYLASPPLVVAYALTGTMNIDLTSQPLGYSAGGLPVYLADIWPSDHEVAKTMATCVTTSAYARGYAEVFDGDHRWNALPTPDGATYRWDPTSTYIKRPPFFDNLTHDPAPIGDIIGARVLVKLGDSVTTDHISPAGTILPTSPAGTYLTGLGVDRRDFNTYLSRRGNHDVMVRGTFANPRLRNELLEHVRGGYTRDFTTASTEPVPIFDAAQRYADADVPLIVLGGKDYGTGSSRDWAAKGPLLLGVRSVIAESFERIHRSNLVGMGILPLQLPHGMTWTDLGIDGTEIFDIRGVEAINSGELPTAFTISAKRPSDDEKNSAVVTFDAVPRIDTPQELAYFRHGGILPLVARQLAGAG